MSHTRTAIATAAIVTTLSAVGPGTQPASASGGFAGTTPPPHWAHSHRPSLQAPTPEPAPVFTTTIHADTDEQYVMAESALAEMAAAGFELPAVTIHLHSDKAGCEQLNGYFVQIEGENIVHSCGNRWTLIHELTHLWDKNTLDEATRQQFMAHQGLDSWHHETWNQAGGEHLASIVAWALDGARPSRIGYYNDDHLADGYAIAAGQPPPTLQQSRATQTRVESAGSIPGGQTSDVSIEMLPR